MPASIHDSPLYKPAPPTPKNNNQNVQWINRSIPSNRPILKRCEKWRLNISLRGWSKATAAKGYNRLYATTAPLGHPIPDPCEAQSTRTRNTHPSVAVQWRCDMVTRLLMAGGWVCDLSGEGGERMPESVLSCLVDGRSPRGSASPGGARGRDVCDSFSG